MSSTTFHKNMLPDLFGRTLQNRLDPVFQAAVDSGRVPGVAAIALDASGQVLFGKGYGKVRSGDEGAADVNVSTPTYIYSCTKLVTSVAALQLLEQGKLQLTDVVQDYLPEFGKIQVLEGFNSDGLPILREPATKAQLIHLFTHTSGLTYDCFDKDTLNYQLATGATLGGYSNPSLVSSFLTPMMFDPGQAYIYGISTDWLGLIVEKITGIKISQYATEHIFRPLGFKNTYWDEDVSALPELFNQHFKDADGQVTVADLARAKDPQVLGGGQYLATSVEDYSQFLLTLLNYGVHPRTNHILLRAETVKEYIFTDQLKSLDLKPHPKGTAVGAMSSAMPQISCEGRFLPGVEKGWSLGLMTNSEDHVNGRRAGSAAWAGLANAYYWMDPAAGKLGMVMSSSFPFFDRDVLHLFDALERAVYDRPAAKEPGEAGSNFEGGWWAS